MHDRSVSPKLSNLQKKKLNEKIFVNMQDSTNTQRTKFPDFNRKRIC